MFRYVHTNIVAKDARKLIAFSSAAHRPGGQVGTTLLRRLKECGHFFFRKESPGDRGSEKNLVSKSPLEQASMVLKQKGFLVFVTRSAGFLLRLWGALIVFSLVFSIPYSLNTYLTSGDRDMLLILVGMIPVNLFLGGYLFLAGSYAGRMFADFRFNEQGILYPGWLHPTQISWQEIQAIVPVKHEVKALLFNRPGMVLNRLYGWKWLNRDRQPAILIAGQATNLERLEALWAICRPDEKA